MKEEYMKSNLKEMAKEIEKAEKDDSIKLILIRRTNGNRTLFVHNMETIGETVKELVDAQMATLGV